jgi:hypothetical protein
MVFQILVWQIILALSCESYGTLLVDRYRRKLTDLERYESAVNRLSEVHVPFESLNENGRKLIKTLFDEANEKNRNQKTQNQKNQNQNNVVPQHPIARNRRGHPRQRVQDEGGADQEVDLVSLLLTVVKYVVFDIPNSPEFVEKYRQK